MKPLGYQCHWSRLDVRFVESGLAKALPLMRGNVGTASLSLRCYDTCVMHAEIVHISEGPWQLCHHHAAIIEQIRGLLGLGDDLARQKREDSKE